MDWFSSFQYKSTLNGNSVQQQRINDKNNLFLAKFKNSPMYKQIGLGSTNSLYDSWVSSEDAWKQLINLKKIELAPNQSNISSNFFTGQYVYWTNNNTNEVWLIVASDIREPFNPMGMMARCDSQLIWKDSNGITQSYYCVIDDKVERDYLRPDKEILLPEGYIQVKLQRNNITNTIVRNQRFLIGTSGNYTPYKVSGLKNYFDFPYLELKMYVDVISPNDDLINGIANGLNIYPSATPTTGNFILPNNINNTIKVFQGQQKTFSVYHYINGIADNTIFTITSSGVSSNYYTLATTNNSFTINSNGYVATSLQVICTNQSDNSQVSITIQLEGYF